VNAATWLRELGEAADELGYGVVEIRPGSIELGAGDLTVSVESILLSGALLREVIRPIVKEPKP
jgi:hypothetical protein